MGRRTIRLDSLVALGKGVEAWVLEACSGKKGEYLRDLLGERPHQQNLGRKAGVGVLLVLQMPLSNDLCGIHWDGPGEGPVYRRE